MNVHVGVGTRGVVGEGEAAEIPFVAHDTGEKAVISASPGGADAVK